MQDFCNSKNSPERQGLGTRRSSLSGRHKPDPWGGRRRRPRSRTGSSCARSRCFGQHSWTGNYRRRKLRSDENHFWPEIRRWLRADLRWDNVDDGWSMRSGRSWNTCLTLGSCKCLQLFQQNWVNPWPELVECLFTEPIVQWGTLQRCPPPLIYLDEASLSDPFCTCIAPLPSLWFRVSFTITY